MNDTDGVIDLDTPFAVEIGFTSDKFAEASYLWRRDDAIVVSFVYSIERCRGYFSALIAAIEVRGLKVIVPTPSDAMRGLLERRGFVSKYEYDDLWGEDVEIMVRP